MIDFDKVRDKFIKNQRAFLHAAGMHAVNQIAEEAHIISGTLKNSITYRLNDGSGSKFSTKYGDGVPPSDAMVSNPKDKDTVRAGSALVYAYSQERHNGFMSASLDAIKRDGSLERLAKEAFKIG